jgi:hypothetical protein
MEKEKSKFSGKRKCSDLMGQNLHTKKSRGSWGSQPLHPEQSSVVEKP